MAGRNHRNFCKCKGKPNNYPNEGQRQRTMTQAFQNRKEAKTSNRNSPKYLVVILSISTLITVSFVLYKSVYLPHSVLAMLPNPDLLEIEEQVAEEIRNRRIAVEKNLDSAEDWGRLGMVLDIHNFKQESIPCYKRAAALNPNEFRWSYYGAIVLNETVSPDAFDWFERSNKLKPDYAPLQVQYGQALLNAGHFEEAEKSFNRVVSLLPESSHGYLGLGKISLARGNFQESQEHLLKAIDLDPNHREVHGVLAEVLRRLGKSEESAKELQIANQLPKVARLNDPVYEELVAEGKSAVWYRDRGFNFLAQGMVEEAIEEFLTAMQLRPDPDGYNHIGNLLSRKGQHDEAISYYRLAISLAPNNVTSYNNLGEALFNSGHPEEAIAWFEKCFRINPKFPDAYLNLSAIYLLADHPADAISTLRKGVRSTMGSIPISVRLAWLVATKPNQELRNGAEAIILAKAACQKTEYSDPKILDVLAAGYAEAGQFDPAVQTARKALQLARSSQQEELAKHIQMRLSLYLAGKPFHTVK